MATTKHSNRYLWEMEPDQILSWLEYTFFPAVNHQHKNRIQVVQLFGNLMANITSDQMIRGADSLQGSLAEKLSSLSVEDLTNALVGMGHGAVQSMPCIHSNGLRVKDVEVCALALHQAIQTKLQLDQLMAKPNVIQSMMFQDIKCADKEKQKVKGIQQRVRKTAEGKDGRVAKSVVESAATLATGGVVVPEQERDYKCVVCHNIQQSLFVLDRKQGDVICTKCGAVACQKIIHQGSQYRNFEGEADRNHNGAAYNPLFSNAHNMATGLTRGSFSPPGSAASGGAHGANGCQLQKTHQFIELNLCHFSDKGIKKTKDRKLETRDGYKDQQKKKAFARMQHVADALELNAAVLELAKVLYAKFRDSRQVLKDPEFVIAACLCEAYHQCSLEGRKRLESELQKMQKVVATTPNWPCAANPCGKRGLRAARRSMLHSTRLASNFSCGVGMGARDTIGITNSSGDTLALECKPIYSWDIAEARTWLLSASQAISQKWLQQQDRGGNTTKLSRDELEGILASYTLDICEYLDKGNGETSSSKRSVGKKLLLMSAKKLTLILRGDAIAAIAFHQKLRWVVNGQAARRSHFAQKKASQLRFQQSRMIPKQKQGPA